MLKLYKYQNRMWIDFRFFFL